jgi:tetratricopeptide (TPR) repeat protein
LKQEKIGTMASIILGILGTMVLALPLFTQKDFNVEERKMVENFKRATPFYLEAAKQFAKDNLDKAEKKLQEALAIMPEHADAYYLMAQIQLKRKEFSQALASIIAAEKNYAAIAKFQTFTHQQYFDQLRQQRQDLEEKRGKIQDALVRLPPLNPKESAAIQDRGRYDAEIQAITRIIQQIDTRLNSPIPPTFEIPAGYFYIHGNALFRQGMLVDAAAKYQEAIRLEPSYGNAYNNLALVSFSLGKYQEALDCLLRAEAAGIKINQDFKRAIEAKISPK